jgi:glycerophosphoryl diester phosphodiesterase
MPRIAIALSIAAVLTLAAQAQPRKVLIAHRGASGLAPEHTIAAYKLAMEHRADFVEPDLGVTKDGVLVCLHDDTLERTTNVAEVFPSRASTVEMRQPGPHWLALDFTVADIKRLDAGKWFKPEFAGQRVPTFQEMIDLVRTRPGTGIYPELKSPELYTSRNIDQVKLFVDLVKKNRLETPESLKSMPVIIQSFDIEAVRRVSKELPTIPRVFLTSREEDVSETALKNLKTFASGIAPEKKLVAAHPELVKTAHALGLTVTVWTFRADEKTSYPSVKDEMAHFLYTLGIDALFTNNPDQFPR